MMEGIGREIALALLLLAMTGGLVAIILELLKDRTTTTAAATGGASGGNEGNECNSENCPNGTCVNNECVPNGNDGGNGGNGDGNGGNDDGNGGNGGNTVVGSGGGWNTLTYIAVVAGVILAIYLWGRWFFSIGRYLVSYLWGKVPKSKEEATSVWEETKKLPGRIKKGAQAKGTRAKNLPGRAWKGAKERGRVVNQIRKGGDIMDAAYG